VRTRIRYACIVLALLCVAAPAIAADQWVQIETGDFTVVSNGGDATARRVLWEFEQVRGAMQKGFPFARVALDRPIVIIAAKDESTMAALTPQFGAKGDPRRPVSLRVPAPDRHYILLRANGKVDATDVNPYLSAYWSYVALTLDGSFGGTLPLWLTNGLAAVLANSEVRDSQIRFGRAIPPFARRVAQEPMLPLRDLLAVDTSSPAYTDPVSHARFEAQCWALVHYLLFGVPGPHGQALSAATARLAKREPSVSVLEQTFGPLATLERDYMAYLRKGQFPFTWIEVESDVSVKKYPTAALAPAESAAMRASFLAAAGRPTEAAAMLADARAAGGDIAAVFEADGVRLETIGDRQQSTAAYEKAIALGTVNFYPYFAVARSRWERGTNDDVETLLANAIRLNARFGPSQALLGAARLRANDPGGALTAIARAATLEPESASVRLLLARALLSLSRFDDALTAVKDAQVLALTEDERRGAQTLSAAIAAARAPARTPPAAVVGGLPGVPPPPPPPPGTAVRVGGRITPPAKLKDVPPVYPEIAQSARVQGVVVVEAVIGTDGHVTEARILRSIPLLDLAALDAVKQWEFAPTVVDGVAVPVVMAVTVQFTLQ
jgi:TonB family protein